METQFKLAKVGKQRERKRAGAAWFFGRGAGAGFEGAIGGSSALARTLVLLATAAGLSAGAWQIGTMLRPQESAASKRPKLFNSGTAQYKDLSGVVKGEAAIPNSLGYISGGADSDEAAKKAAAAAAGASSSAAGETAAAGEASSSDPNAPSGGLGGGAVKESSLGHKFGQLSTGFGGSSSLAGGAGLSGGINRGFGDAAKLAVPKGQNGAMGSFHNPGRVTTARAASRPPLTHTRGFAKSQLANAYVLSRQASSSGGTEAKSDLAAAAFDNNPGQGNVIAGQSGGLKSSPAGTVVPATPSGPLDTAPACGTGQFVGSDGTCQATGGTTSANATPYQGLIDTAKALMAIAAILALILMLLRKFSGYIADAYTQPIKYAIMAIGAVISALGIAIMAMSGDMMIGGIVTAVGGFTIASAYFSDKLAGMFGNTDQIVAMAAGTLISNAAGFLAASSLAKPANWD